MADNYTRRAFLTGRPIRDAVEDGTEANAANDEQSGQPRSDQAASESDAASTGSSRSWLVPTVVRIVAVAVLLIVLGQLAGVGLAEATSAPAVGGVVQQDDDPAGQCGPPNADRRTAHDRLDALQRSTPRRRSTFR